VPIKDYGNSNDGEEHPIIIGERITAFNVSPKIQAQITNIDEYTFLKTSDYPSGGTFRSGKYLDYLIFNKKTSKEFTHAHRSDGDYIVVLKKKTINKSSRSGSSGTGNNSDTNSDNAPYVAGYSHDGAKETDETTVHIIKPANGSTVKRNLTGVDIDIVFPQTKSAELTWSGTAAGSDSVTSDVGNWVNRLSLPPGNYELTGLVPDNTHTIQFTLILAPVLRGYTAEDIQLLNTFIWGGYNRSPEAKLVQTLAREAGLVDEGDDFSDTVTGSTVTDRVQNFSKQAKGDYNLFYSGSGDKAFIEKKINRLFGKHLSNETRTKLIETVESKKTAGFIDATEAFHEAMNNTLNIFFAKNSVGRIISEMDTPLVVTPGMMLVMDAAKTVVNIKLNIQLAQSSNGAPLLMQQEAQKNVFDMVALEVVGLAVGGVVLKALSKGFKVTRSYFKKFEHKFSKKTTVASASSIAVRKKLATEFYEKQGFDKFDIDSHLDGINFNKPVETSTLKKGTILEQWQLPNRWQGNYYAKPGVKPTELGISDKALNKDGIIEKKIPIRYIVTEDVKVLKSTAAPYPDRHSIPNMTVETNGGATQYMTKNKNIIKPL